LVDQGKKGVSLRVLEPPPVIELSRYVVEPLRKDENYILYRGRSKYDTSRILVLSPLAEYPAPEILRPLEHEYSLKLELDPTWATRPIAIAHHWDRTVLVLMDPGGVPLDQLLGQPLEMAFALRVAICLSTAIGHLHQRGLIHKDVKPANVLVDSATGQCWLTGFGIASRLPRERQPPGPPEFIAGTLPYMAPEQTGRMNRSIDSRSDLYALGVTLYHMLTGRLPFSASDPMEWVHCHIARQPAPPDTRSKTVPALVSGIVMKLLAKTAEERYQTAAGLESDLRRCLVEWEAQRRIVEFPLAEHDTPDRLRIPEKLYGRDHEIDTLLGSFDRVVVNGRPELVLVSGYSGIGKSSVISELHKVLVPPRGLFASGKFDQYKRNIPYSTLAQAYQSLVRSVLAKSEAELSNWRDALREALGPNGQLMADLVPELKLIIGEQPAIPDLPPQDAKARFQLVLRRFVGVFAQQEHPLALFLDDLQWLDVATLDFMQDLLTQPDVHHLLLIGAYRDNEVDPAHPLWRKLDVIRQAGAHIREIVLAPLTCQDLGRLLAETLHCQPERITPLALLVHAKTIGNPFFAIQFITALAEEHLLTFDHDAGRWSWDLNRIQAKDYTDNVAELMAGKLNRLTIDTQKALQEFACLGNSVPISTLSIVHGHVLDSQDGNGETSQEALTSDLWEAERLELVVRSEGFYRFAHDRVQEAAYSLIPEASRAKAHLNLGRLLNSHTLPHQREEAVFEIVSQFNRGAALITSQKEREAVAELNLLAGRRAKTATAYAPALNYLISGAALLADDSWEQNHKLAFTLELNRAECEFLTGQLAAAEERLAMLSSHTANTVELATVACLRMDLYTTLDQSDRAVAVCLEYLRQVNIVWSSHPSDEDVRCEYGRIWSHLGSRTIEDLLDSPLMEDAASFGTIAVLSKAFSPALFTDANLASLTICGAVSLSLERGICDASCFAFAWLGMIAGRGFGDYDKGFRFGQVGYELVERRGLKRFEASTYLAYVIVVARWTKHIRASRVVLRHAFEVANRIGDLTFGAYICNHLNSDLLFAGDPLPDVQREAENGLEFAEKALFGLVVDIVTTQIALIRSLRGLTPEFGCFEDGHIEEHQIEHRLSSKTTLAIAACWYWIRKMQARYIAGQYDIALEASSKAQRLIWTSPCFLEEAEYHFYSALSRAASWNSAGAQDRRHHLDALTQHHEQLTVWAKNCPENFENRAALIGAEIARIEGHELAAEHLYEQAIRSAHANGFVHNEALANELAARFYLARGFEKIGHTYLRDARHCYLRWGAAGKVRQLEELHPQIRGEEAVAGSTSTIGTPVEHLDLATVVKVSQAVSGEIVLERLVDTIMRKAIEHAGAQRGLLILVRDQDQRIEAEAMTSGDTIVVRLQEVLVAEAAVPQSIIRYVSRTHESVILDDALARHPFSADGYVRQLHARSILCLPLINQAKLIGLLYLENNLSPNVFTPTRIAVLKLLASQAAISLENTRLYRGLEAREAKIRRLVDANIIGIFMWNLEGQIIEANEAFLEILKFSREDLISGRVQWPDLTPAEWRDRDECAVAEIKATGAFQPFQKEYLRKDGSRVPVMIGAAMFERSGSEGVAFVLDLSQQKHAEDERKRAEEALQEAQTELAHVTRVAALGELTASIAHEINQPLGAVVNNASACLRWLRANNLEEARQSASLVIEEGHRAGEIISRVRALAKKAPPQKDWLEINETIGEVIAMARNGVQRNRISLQTQLANDLPLILGDKIQLQQVILNLLINAIEAMSVVSEGPRELLVSSQRFTKNPPRVPHAWQTGEADEDEYAARALAEAEGVCALIAVRNSGPTLDPNSLDRLFDAFYTTKPQGLGMGLAISRSIIEAHGGRLWAKANVPRGAVFQFTLPFREDVVLA
jgi:PAS domain S-box-containing protein